MPSVNRVTLLGNLGENPNDKLISLPSGTATTVLSVATNESYKDKEGNRVERTEWHRVVVYGKPAENAAKHLDKGQQVLVEGSLRTRNWEDKEGVTRYTTEVVAKNIQYLGKPKGDASTESFTEDDIPFD